MAVFHVGRRTILVVHGTLHPRYPLEHHFKLYK